MTTQSYLALLGLYTIASLIGAGSYLLVRYVERKFWDIGMVLAAWEIVFLAFLSYIFSAYLFSIPGVVAVLFLISGSWLHHKSSESSKSGIEAIGFVSLAMQFSLFFGAFFFNVSSFLFDIHLTARLAIPRMWDWLAVVVFYSGCALGTWVTIALSASAKVFKSRPGLDV